MALQQDMFRYPLLASRPRYDIHSSLDMWELLVLCFTPMIDAVFLPLTVAALTSEQWPGCLSPKEKEFVRSAIEFADVYGQELKFKADC